MPNNAYARHEKRAAARLRALRRRAAEWKRKARHALAASLIASGIAVSSMIASPVATAQMGQMGMTPAGGVVNRAVNGFKDLNANGPGWMYYGINAADRGLGYQGSYMTVGGFIPYSEDDLGGFWAADIRGHLSTYGGFFSNVGAVRKQFLGGSLLGIGVYWDYDGDLNQYSDTTITDSSGSYVFAGGQAYNQVGVSAEWLTDFGNLRSNGYIPVGSTGQVMGSFVGNSLLCTPGINAALAGTDLEIGAYVPGLSDWAGMISVGGYAYGNAIYDLDTGKDAVPWFGGVYTRLDMTLIENWDFSLQYNNDSFFDSTGFARLTYRMGGSRRRNVPDQMEQPMMRNEHIVRAHQAPEQAINPYTNDPWRVIHVDNSSSNAAVGDGTAQSPFTRLTDASGPNANSAADRDFDIVYVHQGNSLNTPYMGTYVFTENNQYLVGEGTSLTIPTVDCGYLRLGPASSNYPVITAPNGGAAIAILDGDATNMVVDHLSIVGASYGIYANASGLPFGGMATFNDIRITGNGPSQTGVYIADTGTAATYNFSNMQLANLTADGFIIDSQAEIAEGVSEPAGSPNVNITASSIKNTSGSALVVNAFDGEGRVRLASSTINGATGPGVVVTGANAIIESSTISNVGSAGVQVSGAPVLLGITGTAGTANVQVTNSTITAPIGILASAIEQEERVNLTATQNRLLAPLGGNGINLAVGGSNSATSQGTINANMVGNLIGAASTTAVATGTAGGITSPTALASGIYMTTSSTAAGLGTINVKAASQDNLTALNRNATVTTNPIFNPINTGTTTPLVPPPPPPTYNPATVVPTPIP
jgi:hypothetical protein